MSEAAVSPQEDEGLMSEAAALAIDDDEKLMTDALNALALVTVKLDQDDKMESDV